MQGNMKRSLHCLLVAIAMISSVISLVALFGFDATRWTTPLNIGALICIVLAVKIRGGAIDAKND